MQTLNKRSRFPKLALSHKHYAVFTLRSHFLLAHKTQMEPYILATKASVHVSRVVSHVGTAAMDGLGLSMEQIILGHANWTLDLDS